jgi:hypothetical protein
MSSLWGGIKSAARPLSAYGRGNSTGRNLGMNSSGMGGYQSTGSSDTHEFGRMQQFTPEQMQLFQQLFGHLGPDSFLSKLAGGDEEMFNQIEAPAKRQFSGQIGNLASRFSGTGLGARHSSGFQNAATAASGDFAQGLQSQRLGLQRQAIGDLLGLSNQLLGQRPYETFATEKKPSFLESLMGGLGSGAGQAGGAAAIMKLLPLLGLL